MRWAVVMVVVGLGVGGCSASVSSDDDAEMLRLGAFDVCTQFVKDELLSQSSAEFPDPLEDDGEVRISHQGERYTVVSQVDAANGFGAKITTPFLCEVRHVDGDRWQLVDLNLEG